MPCNSSGVAVAFCCCSRPGCTAWNLSFSTLEGGISINHCLELTPTPPTYIWSEFVCAIAFASSVIRSSSRTDSRFWASSATRGWNSKDLFRDAYIDWVSLNGSSLSTAIDRGRSVNEWDRGAGRGTTTYGRKCSSIRPKSSREHWEYRDHSWFPQLTQFLSISGVQK